MKRTLVQLDEDTYRKLRKKAFRQERPISSLVREMVALGLEGGTRREKRPHGRKLLSVAAGRSGRRVSPVSERHDEALASLFEMIFVDTSAIYAWADTAFGPILNQGACI